MGRKSGAPGRSCTCNPRLRSALLWLLSYGSLVKMKMAALAGVAPARSESESDALLLSYKALFVGKMVGHPSAALGVSRFQTERVC